MLNSDLESCILTVPDKSWLKPASSPASSFSLGIRFPNELSAEFSIWKDEPRMLEIQFLSAPKPHNGCSVCPCTAAATAVLSVNEADIWWYKSYTQWKPAKNTRRVRSLLRLLCTLRPPTSKPAISKYVDTNTRRDDISWKFLATWPKSLHYVWATGRDRWVASTKMPFYGGGVCERESDRAGRRKVDCRQTETNIHSVEKRETCKECSSCCLWEIHLYHNTLSKLDYKVVLYFFFFLPGCCISARLPLCRSSSSVGTYVIYKCNIYYMYRLSTYIIRTLEVPIQQIFCLLLFSYPQKHNFYPKKHGCAYLFSYYFSLCRRPSLFYVFFN